MPRSRRTGLIWCLNFWLPSWFCCCWSHGTLRPSSSSTGDSSKPFKFCATQPLPNSCLQCQSWSSSCSKSAMISRHTGRQGRRKFLPHWINQLLFQINVTVLVMVTSPPLAGKEKTVFKGCLWWCSLCVGSFPDPTSDEAHSRWVSFTSGAGRHGACLSVLCSLLEEGPGE